MALTYNSFMRGPHEDDGFADWIDIEVCEFDGEFIPYSVTQAIVFIIEHPNRWGGRGKATARLALALRRRFPKERWAKRITGEIVREYYDKVEDEIKNPVRLPPDVDVEEWYWRYEIAFRDMDRAAAKEAKEAKATWDAIEGK